MMRTDENNNPTAFTTAIAENAGLVYSIDYTQGTSFTVNGIMYFTAKILVDPIDTTIRVIDAIGFTTKSGLPRWTYIRFPHFVWLAFNRVTKRDIIGWMYENEGGETMRNLFPNYGKK